MNAIMNYKTTCANSSIRKSLCSVYFLYTNYLATVIVACYLNMYWLERVMAGSTIYVQTI